MYVPQKRAGERNRKIRVESQKMVQSEKYKALKSNTERKKVR